MIKFIQTSRDQNTKITLNNATHIDATVQGFIAFLRAIGYHEDTIANALVSADIVENYLADDAEKEGV
jgi:hypothetical protein